MKIRADIKFKYVDEKYANISFNSMEPDNIGFIKSRLEDEFLICSLSGDSIGRLLATADDLIFCEMMVEKISDLLK